MAELKRRRRGNSLMSPERAAEIERQVKAEVRQLLGEVPSETAADPAKRPVRYQPYKTYLITAEGLSLGKIGRAKDPRTRLRQLQTGQPVELSLAWACDGDFEQALHRRFADNRVRGEWFDLASLGNPAEILDAAVAEIREARGY
ncbi:GIY-YIG nuclease family protein [Streptomyces sp. NPDC048521]|uniref:GIY-YIG nuclease family protein n=1 Tax=Streptomyces sp. NPDC048521 TaxID=3365566 RepID=UPI00372258CA